MAMICHAVLDDGNVSRDFACAHSVDWILEHHKPHTVDGEILSVGDSWCHDVEPRSGVQHAWILSNQHWLVVLDDQGAWEIDHPPGCPMEEVECGGVFSYWEYQCGVAQVLEMTDMVLDDFGVSEPGRYPVEYWFENHTNRRGGPEFSCGIRLVEGAA